jgi:hypothetical protein
MQNLRGQNYRRALQEIGPKLLNAAENIFRDTHAFTLRNIGELAKQFDLPAKTTSEFLEHQEFLPSGEWERLSKATKKEIRKVARGES